MKCLVCAHHIYSWAGSELVTIELVEALRARDHDVALFCIFTDIAFVRGVLGPEIKIVIDPGQVDLSEYDLVFVNHQATARCFALQSDDLLFGTKKPVFVYNHMSPNDLFERPSPVSEDHFADHILCNSPETKDALCQFSSRFNEAMLWPNPAPVCFERPQPPEAPERLERVLCVSNHLPEVLSQALDVLREQGVSVTRVGRPDHSMRLTPDILVSHDAVVTIGKTVQYALRARVPVFCYDRYHGPGWLLEDNFELAAERNFSGRSHPIPRLSEVLAQEIIEGFPNAARFAREISQDQIAPFRLETHITRLESLVMNDKPSRRTVSQHERASLKSELLREKEMFGLIDQEYAAARRKRRSIFGVSQVSKSNCQSPISISYMHRQDTNRPFIAAVFSYRYDAHLVSALQENIAPSVDAFIAWDDRQADTEFNGDAKRQAALFAAARSIGAEWVLAVDPDERFEDALAHRIDEFTTQDPACWTFQCREMFTPHAYRADGMWGNKPRLRLFPCMPGMEPDEEDLHGNWTRNGLNLPVRDTQLNFYHLRMATSERRKHRRDTYAIADPGREYQGVGYDYLADERGCVLVNIPEERTYSPAHIEDGSLWAGQSQINGHAVQPDPVHSRLRWMTQSTVRGGEIGSFYGAKDLFDRRPDDSDLGYMAAGLALDANMASEARELLSRIKQTPIMSKCHVRLLNRIQQVSGKASENGFHANDAVWRRWVSQAQIHEGSKVSQSDLAVIVLGLRAPPQIEQAVASLRAQSEPLEIVVVNSGGGSPESVLCDHMDHIRLIDVSERLYPGGARNVGIDASSAPFVSFLASDCIADAGWAKGRLERHRSGAQAVASAVVPVDPDNVSSIASYAQLHWPRWPQTNPEVAALYGVSYARRLFAECGYFPTGLLVGEDTQVNRMVQEKTGIAWAPEVKVAHRYPTSLSALWKDMNRRGYNRTFVPPFSKLESEAAFSAFIDKWIRGKTEKAHAALLAHAKPSSTRLKRILWALRLAARAERVGVSRGAKEVILAHELMREAKGLPSDRAQEALILLQRAASCIATDPACLAALVRHLVASGPERHMDELTSAAYRLVALDPHESMEIVSVCQALNGNGRAQETQKILRYANLAAPERKDLWWQRSLSAQKVGDFRDEYDCLQVQLCFTPCDAKLHSALAKLHASQGNQKMSDYRHDLAKLL